jgi:hypothetical protein
MHSRDEVEGSHFEHLSGKEIAQVIKVVSSGKFHSRIISGVLSILLILGVWSVCPADDSDSRCTVAKDKWEQIVQQLKERLHNYSTIQQTSAERILQRPVVDRSSNKTIARQISEALQVKEDMLNAKRKECRNLMNLENQAFGELQDCMNRKGSKDKDVKNLSKNRQAFLDKAVITLAEVREVEGKETFMPYADAGNDPDPYRRSVNNQWQNYQQMYRQWWVR